MKSAKVVAKKTLNDPELSKMMEQMVGVRDPDTKIIAEKYDSIMKSCREICDIVKLVFIDKNGISASVRQEFNLSFAEFTQFYKAADAELRALHLPRENIVLQGEDLKNINSDPKRMQEHLQQMSHGYNPSELAARYTQVKESNVVDKIIVLARDLRQQLDASKKAKRSEHHDLENLDALRDDFITSEITLDLIPSISKLDFAQMFMHPAFNAAQRKLVLDALAKILKRANTVVDNIMSPDIDINKFSHIIVDSIDKLRARVPRCDKAFNKIRDSVDLLKGNFSEYYKDFVVSKKSNIIIENFVLDVARDKTVDRETARQFRQIMNFFRKQMANQKASPEIERVLDALSENIGVLESKTGKRYKQNEDTEPEPEPSTENKYSNDWLDDTNIKRKK